MSALIVQPQRYQRGIVTAMAAVILFAAILFMLNQTFGIIGTTSNSNESQGDSIAAFFLAESGVEQGKSLISISGPTSRSVCEGLSASSNNLVGRGSFSLSGAAAPTDCINNCNSCTITSTGTVGSSSRSVEVVMSVSAPSGGAAGCGGGGASFTGCPVSGINPADIYDYIKQTIQVTIAAPVVLFSNMAYIRHPAGSSNNINADECVAEPGGNVCTTQWNDESNHSAGSTVVGSRGSAILVSPASVPVTYELKQSLTNDSLFASIAAKFGGSGLAVVGSGEHSYWDDSSGNGNATVAGNSTAGGKTTNGAACSAPNGGTCPNTVIPPAVIPDPPSSGTKQASKSWCYDADTLVFGFSGKSSTNNDGTINSFTFGASPQSAAVPTPGTTPAGVVAYPRPVTGVTNSELYASLRYIYNKSYLSASGAASSGGLVSAKAGIPNASLTASVTSGSPTLTVTGMTGYTIHSGDKVYCSSNGAGCTAGTLVGTITGNTACSGAFPCSIAGTYTLGANSPLSNSTRLEVRSTVLHAASFAATNGGWLSSGDVLTVSGTATTTKITSMATGCTNTTTCQVAPGDYGIDVATVIASGTSNVETNGYTIHVSSGTEVPPAGTIVEARGYPAAGLIGPLACVASTDSPDNAPERSASLFYLNDYIDTGDPLTSYCGTNRLTNGTSNANGTVTRLVANQICGGICAFFNHNTTTNGGMTNFTIGITNTNQWAAGMTCLKGVDPSTIEGLVGSQPTVTATRWHETVR